MRLMSRWPRDGSFCRLWRRVCPLAFPGFWRLLACGPFVHCQSTCSRLLLPSLYASCLPLTRTLVTTWIPCTYSGVISPPPGPLLNHTCTCTKSRVPCKVTRSQFQGLGCRHLWEVFIQPTTFPTWQRRKLRPRLVSDGQSDPPRKRPDLPWRALSV